MSTNSTSAEAIWTTIGAIPRGKVASYGQVAELAGLPGRARLVGRVLRELPEHSALPWHRVLRSNGQIAFAADSSQCHEQITRLQAEGVTVTNGKVRMREFGWQPQAGPD